MRTNTLILSCIFLSFGTIFVLPLLMKGVVSSSTDVTISSLQKEQQSTPFSFDLQQRGHYNTTALAAESDGWHSIVEVIDGDTIDVMVDDVVQSVRLIGINTPEVANEYGSEDECFGPEAKERLEYMLEEHDFVFLLSDESQDDTDKYGRLLRYVYVQQDGEWVNINFSLLYDGYAYEYTYYQNPYPYQMQYYFQLAEYYARYWGHGLWSECYCSHRLLCSW